MSKKSKIIAFAGRKRSGKGMLAKGMREYSPNVVIIAVADSLKFLCCKLLNRTYDELNQMKDDGTTFEAKVDDYWVSTIKHEVKISDNIIRNEIGGRVFTNVREVLQIIGTDLIRKYSPDWHIDKTIERIKSYGDDKIVVVEDVRFPNEKRRIEEIGGDVYFMVRPNYWDVSNHPSEKALKYTDFNDNRIIINEYSKEQMIEYFNALYFTDEYINENECPILLSANPWYSEHVMDITTNDFATRLNRQNIIKKVIKQNKGRALFREKGIITFKSDDADSLNLFRRIIMVGCEGYGCESYSIYNPLTNEILKLYL